MDEKALLIRAHKDFHLVFCALMGYSHEQLYPDREKLCRQVLSALTKAQTAKLAAGVNAQILYLYGTKEPVEDPVAYIQSASDPRDQLIINADHPGYILESVIGDAVKHFSLCAGDADVDREKLVSFVRGAAEQRMTRMSGRELERLISILPIQYVMPDTRLSEEITKDKLDAGEFLMVVSEPKRKSDKPVVTKAIFTFGGDTALISGRQKYTPYDRAVYSGIISLYDADNTIFTPAMVYRAMNGLSESEYVNPGTLEKVTKSIEKSRKSILTIDYTEEARPYMSEPSRDFSTTYEGNLLTADKITVRNNGVEQTAYKILRKPILYEYAQTVNQVISVPIKLLQTKGSIRSTEDVIVLREYLLRRIENYKRRHKCGSFSIAYADIYELFGISEDAYKNVKDKCKKIRSHTETILGEWVRQAYIASFESRREGSRAIATVEIIMQ